MNKNGMVSWAIVRGMMVAVMGLASLHCSDASPSMDDGSVSVTSSAQSSGRRKTRQDAGSGSTTGSDGGTATDTDGGTSTTSDSGASSDPSTTYAQHTCSKLLTGASGSEPGGAIPVCCAPTIDERADIDKVLALLNDYRKANGLEPLTRDPALEAAVQGHCLHMGTHSFFSHYAPEASVEDPWIRASLCGTSAGGENLAWGYGTPTDVMNGWKASSGHNANMLNSDYKRVGICKYGSYWGQLFGW